MAGHNPMLKFKFMFLLSYTYVDVKSVIVSHYSWIFFFKCIYKKQNVNTFEFL